jgi:hypothetical protein
MLITKIYSYYKIYLNNIKSNKSILSQQQIKIGIVELGKWVEIWHYNLLKKIIAVIGKALRNKPELERKGVRVVTDYDSFTSFLNTPRGTYLSLSAGHSGYCNKKNFYHI